MSWASLAALSRAWDGVASPYIALPSWSFSSCSMRGHFGFEIVFVTPHFIASAKPLRIGFFCTSSGDSRSDLRGGSSVLPFASNVHWERFSGRERYSSQSQAAALFFEPSKSTRLSPAMVVLQPASPSGSGAAAHLPLIFGNSVCNAPANHAPAMYIATFPCAKATRPSYEFELRKSAGEYLRRPT